MKYLFERFVDLINVKTIVTFAVIAVFVVLALRGDISSEVTMTIVTMVVAFYFGTQHEKRNGAGEPSLPEETTAIGLDLGSEE